ncbi:MAG: signal peptidase II [Rickettsiales bacterium]|jgi:signal peptidase II|nr:signal peptidase II [Rickettsiales bacterium]
MRKSIIYSLLSILVVVILDQLTKGALLYFITGGIPFYGPAWTVVPNPGMFPPITSFFNLVFTWNPGTSFSLFRALGESAPIVIVVLTGIIIGFLCQYLFSRAHNSERLPLALIIGGAFGNLIDRVRFGAVIDFLDFHWKAWHWPAFNVADICICIGVCLLILNLILKKGKGK